MIRIWVGVHPSELDDDRIVQLHEDVHTVLELMDQNPWSSSQLPPEIVGKWDNGRGIASLNYLHGLLGQVVLPSINVQHTTPLSFGPELLKRVNDDSPFIYSLQKDGAPSRWPPGWIDSKQRIADLKDLQIRWRNEGHHQEFRRSVQRYSLWQGGKLEGAFDPKDVSDAEANIYIRHIKERAKFLANGRKGPDPRGIDADEWRCPKHFRIDASGIRDDMTCMMCGSKMQKVG